MDRWKLVKLGPPGRQMPPWAKWLGAVVAVTLLALAWTWYDRRQFPERSLIPLEELGGLNYEPYWVGLLVQMVVVPLALLFILGNMPLFRRIVSGKTRPRDRTKFFLGLVIIQVLSFGYRLAFARLVGEPPDFVHLAQVSLIVLSGGLLGGWRMGFGLALIGVFLHGTRGFVTEVFWQWSEIRFIWQTDGLSGVILHLPWKPMLQWNYVQHPRTVSGLWVGGISGLMANLVGRYRYSSVFALLLGALADFGGKALIVLAGDFIALEFLIPGMLVVGLSMAVVALMVRGVQGEVARREAAVSELDRTRAELRALRAQINPHFLFNSLNTIRYFVRTDPDTARDLLLNLSEVFQRALRSGDFVPLGDEISYVQAYLALESARLGDRLVVEWILDADSWMEYPVPTLILQPLVENAVIYAVAQDPKGGAVRITIRPSDGALVFWVEDDGPGISPERLAEVLGPAGTGDRAVGLRNVDGRLRVLYGDAYGLEIDSRLGEGTRVKMRVPLEE